MIQKNLMGGIFMKAMLHGVRRVDMTDRETQRPIKGFSLFVSYPADGVQGEETAKLFVADDLCVACAFSPSVGKLLSIDFTPKGRVCGISHDK